MMKRLNILKSSYVIERKPRSLKFELGGDITGCWSSAYIGMALHTSTILARTPAAFLSHISRLSTTYTDHAVMFALNANAPELPTLVSRLTKFSPQTIGCLSAPLPGLVSEGLISCSLAVFDKRVAVSLRSTIPGRAAPQVGRWHAFRQRNDKPEKELPPGMVNGLGESMNWDSVWDRSVGDDALPTELQALRCV
jgi:hypothetical protein